MQRILIGDLGQHVGEAVSISGWVDVRRDHGKLIFLVVRDRSGNVQAVVNAKNEDAFQTASELRSEWAIRLEGEVKERPESMRKDEQNGSIELGISSIEILGKAQELPFDTDAELNLDTLLDYRPLTLRRKRERAIFKVP
jgi:aspartyl-tRNA synthetase